MKTTSIYEVLHVEHFTIAHGRLLLNSYTAEVEIEFRSHEWAVKTWWVLALWNAEYRGNKKLNAFEVEVMEQANVDKLIRLRKKNGGKYMADLINKEFARVKTKLGYYDGPIH